MADTKLLLDQMDAEFESLTQSIGSPSSNGSKALNLDAMDQEFKEIERGHLQTIRDISNEDANAAIDVARDLGYGNHALTRSIAKQAGWNPSEIDYLADEFKKMNAVQKGMFGVVSGINDIGSTLARPLDLLGYDVADDVNRINDDWSQAIEKADDSFIGHQSRGMSRSLTHMLPAVLAGGSPAVIEALNALSTGITSWNSSLTEARDAGMSEAKAQGKASIDGILEGLITYTMGKALGGGLEGSVAKTFGDKPLEEVIKRSLSASNNGIVEGLKRFGLNGLKEIPEEVMIAIGQSLNAIGFGTSKVEDFTPEQIGKTLTDITVQSMLLGGGMETVQHNVNRFKTRNIRPFVESPTRSNAKSLPAELKALADQSGMNINTKDGREQFSAMLKEIDSRVEPVDQNVPEAPEQDSGAIAGQDTVDANQPVAEIPSMLDIFEAEQQERLSKRAGGDRRVSIVNHHPVTDMVEGKYANKRLAEIGLDVATKSGVPVTYVEGDLHNLGGLNEEFGQTGADVHFKAMAEIAKEEFDKLGVEASYTTKGGDEFGFTFVNATKEQVDAAIDKIKPRMVQYVKDNKLDKIKHTKEGKNAGSGINFASRQFDPEIHQAYTETLENGKTKDHDAVDVWIQHADRALEIEKKLGGMQDEQQEQTGKTGTVAPGEQATGATEGATGTGSEAVSEEEIARREAEIDDWYAPEDLEAAPEEDQSVDDPLQDLKSVKDAPWADTPVSVEHRGTLKEYAAGDVVENLVRRNNSLNALLKCLKG